MVSWGAWLLLAPSGLMPNDWRWKVGSQSWPMKSCS